MVTKRIESSGRAPAPPGEAVAHAVTLRTMYAEAMREVMADPRKALAEHDPRLASLLIPGLTPGTGKG
jgi:hypothetical protein